MSSEQFSIWLVPPDDEYRRYTEIIDSLADKYGSPRFEPHITLLGGLKVPESRALHGTEYLATRIGAVPVKLLSVDHSSEYFRAVFARAEEGHPLMEANLVARQRFDREEDEPFMPHLSLAYGLFSEGIRREMIENLGVSPYGSFELATLRLMSTGGSVGEWLKVAEIELR